MARKHRMDRARWRPSAWPDFRSYWHFWRNRAYIRWGWQHWPTSADLRRTESVITPDTSPGTCAYCGAAGVPVIPAGTDSDPRRQCLDRKACMSRIDALADLAAQIQQEG